MFSLCFGLSSIASFLSIPPRHRSSPSLKRRLPDHQSSVCGDSAGVTIFVATRTLDYEFVQLYKLNLQIVVSGRPRVGVAVAII